MLNSLRNIYHNHILSSKLLAATRTQFVNSKLASTASHLFKNHLFATNVCISFGLSGLGDYGQQKLEHSKSTSTAKPKWNSTRTLHMSTAFGLTSGFLCHFWYKYLDSILPGRGLKIVVTKIAWDQILFSPVCIVACLLVAGRLENKSSEHLVSQTVQLGGRLYLAEWLIWPPAQFINFAFLPPRFRVVYDNIISLIYDVYTSHVKHEVPVKENFFEEVTNNKLVPKTKHFYQATRW